MHLKYFWNKGKQWLVRGLQAVNQRVRTWTQPAPDRAIKGVVSDLFRSRKDLIAENAFLRQQVIILNRQKQGRAQLTPRDRRLLGFLAHQVDGKTPYISSNRIPCCAGIGRASSCIVSMNAAEQRSLLTARPVSQSDGILVKQVNGVLMS